MVRIFCELKMEDKTLWNSIHESFVNIDLSDLEKIGIIFCLFCYTPASNLIQVLRPWAAVRNLHLLF